jgi:hypothetical protein
VTSPTLVGMFGRRHRRIDRRVAVAAVGLAVLVFIPILATTSAPEPALASNDVKAAFSLVALLARGQKVNFRIDSTFTRTRPGGLNLTATQTEARWGRVHVLAGGGTLQIDLPDKTYICQQVTKGASCKAEPPPPQSSSTAQAMALALGSGAYDIVPAAGRSIAGEPAKCFDVTRHDNAPVIQGLGDETLLCTARDGLVLLSRVRTAEGVDEQRATRVQRTVDLATLQPLFAGFETPPEQLRR